MTQKKLIVGALAVLFIGVLVTVALWSPGSSQPDQNAGANRSLDAGPAKVDPAVAAPSDADAPENDHDRTLVQTDPPAEVPDGPIVTLRGIVVNTDKKPMGNVTVRAGPRSRAGKFSVRAGQGPKTTTTADGSYVLQVRTRRDRKSLRVAAETFGWVTAAQQVAIDGEELTADFELRRAFLVSGRVTDPLGAGIAGARVWTFRPNQRPATTDADGYFRLGDLDPKFEQLYIEASARGFVAKGQMLELEDESRDDVVIVLSPGAIVRGVVYGPGQAPVPDASLVITTGVSKSQHRIEAKSDASGRFEFAGVPGGRHRLVTEHEELAAAIQRIDAPPPGQTLELIVELRPGWTLRGVVRAAGAGPIADATVVARVGSFEKGGGKEELRDAETDAQGAFELRGLPLDTVRLSCNADGFMPAQWMAVDAGTPYREIVLDQAARIAGTVFDALTGAPVTEFAIRLRGDGGKMSGGKALRFNSELGQWDTGDVPMPVGFATDVEVLAKGYAPALVEGAVARTNASYDDYRITLTSGVTLSGTVQTLAGLPMANTRLRLVQGAGDAARGKGGGSGGRRARTDSAGRFAFDNVVHGEVRIVVEYSDEGVFVHRTQIPEGSSEWQVAIRVSAQGELHGVVHEPDGRVVAGADVALTAVEVPGVGGRVWRDKADDAGHFRFRDLPFGFYRLARTESEGKRLETFATHVTVTDPEPLEVDLMATGVGTIRGTLTGDFTIPDGAVVQLIPQYPDDVPMAERSANRYERARGGAFVFEGVEPGRYRLTAYCLNEPAGEWRYGSVDAEVKQSGETQVEVNLDSSK